VGYLCANFGLPRPLGSRLRPDERDRQIDLRQTSDVRQKHRIMNIAVVIIGIVDLLARLLDVAATDSVTRAAAAAPLVLSL